MNNSCIVSFCIRCVGCVTTHLCTFILYVLISVVREYEMYVPRAHFRKGTLRPNCYYYYYYYDNDDATNCA